MRRKFRFRFIAAIAFAACTISTTAGAVGSIQSVLVEPTPPVDSATAVTITTDFEMTSGIDAVFTSVTKVGNTVTVDICVDINLTAEIVADTSIANVGTLEPGEIICQVRLFDTLEFPCTFLRDTASCDFVVTPVPPNTTPALSSWGQICLGVLVMGIASYVLAGRRIA